MAIMRWRPWGDLVNIQDEVNRSLIQIVTAQQHRGADQIKLVTPGGFFDLLRIQFSFFPDHRREFLPSPAPAVQFYLHL